MCAQQGNTVERIDFQWDERIEASTMYAQRVSSIAFVSSYGRLLARISLAGKS